MERVPSPPEVLTKPLSVKLESLGMEAEVVARSVPTVRFPIEEVAATVPVNWIKVVVAFARRPPQVGGVQEKVPPPVGVPQVNVPSAVTSLTKSPTSQVFAVMREKSIPSVAPTTPPVAD